MSRGTIAGLLLGTTCLLALAPAAPVRAADDAHLTLQAKLALLTGVGREALDIDVDTVGGEVTLHGRVTSGDACAYAAGDVAALVGVGSVRNLLTADRPASCDTEASAACDESLARNVAQALAEDELASVTDVRLASVRHGVVLLEGCADGLVDAEHALRVALRVPGVQRIASRIAVGAWSRMAVNMPGYGKLTDKGPPQARRDDRLTSEVKRRLADGSSPAPQVLLDTDDGVVTLFGPVANEEGRLAALAVARAVPTVREVLDDLQLDTAPHAAKLAIVVDASGLAALVRQSLEDQRGHLSQDALEALLIEAKLGVIRLAGDVPLASDKQLIELFARSVDGVRAVRNELTVAEDPPTHFADKN